MRKLRPEGTPVPKWVVVSRRGRNDLEPNDPEPNDPEAKNSAADDQEISLWAPHPLHSTFAMMVP